MLLSSDRRLLKISDMGYCQDISLSADKKANYTSLKGTQGYIAPEIENGESYTTAADMFSFGRTLWSLIFKDLWVWASFIIFEPTERLMVSSSQLQFIARWR